jgi:tRNA dimethylallyltransferase
MIKFQKIVVVVGPTATNKTKLAITIAKEINGEIINADAFQVYKELNIGVNKPTLQELKEATFHLVGNVSILDK